MIRTGPGTFLVLTHLHARGKGSGAATDRQGANLVALRNGRISRLELVWDMEEALSRAGLKPDVA